MKPPSGGVDALIVDKSYFAAPQRRAVILLLVLL